MKKIWLAVALVLAVAGCSNFSFTEAVKYTMGVVEVTKSIKYVDANLDSALNIIFEEEFYTPEEQLQLSDLITRIDHILADVEAVLNTNDLSTAIITAADINKLSSGSREIYVELKSIVDNHYDQYTPEAQAKLAAIAEKLVHIDVAWRELSLTNDGGDVTPIVTESIRAIGMGFKISKMVKED